MPQNHEGMIFVFTGFAERRTYPFEPHVSGGWGDSKNLGSTSIFRRNSAHAPARVQQCCTELLFFEPPNRNSISVLLPPDHEKWAAAHPRSSRAIGMGLMRSGAIEQRENHAVRTAARRSSRIGMGDFSTEVFRRA